MSDMTQVEQADQPVPTEQEAGQYRELRESLIKLGQIEPGLICETTKDGNPEVIVIPGRDEETKYREGDTRDTVVAISDDKVRILDIISPHWGGGSAGGAEIHAAVSSYFRPNKDGRVMTEEEIFSKIGYGGTGRGFVWERTYVEDLDTKQQILLESLTNRNEENMKRDDEARLSGKKHILLRKAFDPKSLKPGENLAARFNALAQKLSASKST